MAENHPFNRKDIFPSYFANRIQDFLGAAKTDLNLTISGSSGVAVIPDSHLGLAAVSIEGRWRWVEAEVARAVSGAAGTYSVWAVAEDESVNNTPDPFTDHTIYAFDLRISKTKPSGSGAAISRLIGEIDWDGTKITALRQLFGAVTNAMLGSRVVTSEKMKPTLGEKRLAGDQALTGAMADLAGLEEEIVVLLGSKLVVEATFGFRAATNEPAEPFAWVYSLAGALTVDGSEQHGQGLFLGNHSPVAGKPEGIGAAVTQRWVVPLASGIHVIKLRAKATASGSGGLVNTALAEHTKLIWTLFGA